MKASEALRKGMGMVKGQGYDILYDAKYDCACALGCMLLGAGVPKYIIDGEGAIDDNQAIQDYFSHSRILYAQKYKETIESSNDGHLWSLAEIAQRLEDIGE